MAYTAADYAGAREWAVGKTGAEIQAAAQQLGLSAADLGQVLGYSTQNVVDSGYGSSAGMNQGLLGEVYGGAPTPEPAPAAAPAPVTAPAPTYSAPPAPAAAPVIDPNVAGSLAGDPFAVDASNRYDISYFTQDQYDAGRQWASGKTADEIFAKAQELGMSPEQLGYMFGSDGGGGADVQRVAGYGTGINGTRAGGLLNYQLPGSELPDGSETARWNYDINTGWSYDQPKPPPVSVGGQAMQFQPNTDRQVTQNELVEQRIANMIRSGHPLLEQARQRTLEQFAARGLLNSSIAAQAAQEAVLAQAYQIASQDASTYSRQGLTNQAAQNEFAGREQDYIYRGNLMDREYGLRNDMAREERSYNTTQTAARDYRQAFDSLAQQHTDARTRIMMSDMDEAGKTAALQDLDADFRLRWSGVNAGYANLEGWQNAWTILAENPDAGSTTTTATTTTTGTAETPASVSALRAQWAEAKARYDGAATQGQQAQAQADMDRIAGDLSAIGASPYEAR